MNFTEREKELLSLGLLALMKPCGEAFATIHSEAAQKAINEYYKELRELNNKICEVAEKSRRFTPAFFTP